MLMFLRQQCKPLDAESTKAVGSAVACYKIILQRPPPVLTNIAFS